MSRRQAGDVMVVTDREEASVFPTSREESLRSLLIDGTRTPFDIDGSVYGSSVRIRGSGTVEGPVFGSDGVVIETIGNSRVVLRAGVMSPGGVVMDLDGSTDVFSSPATSVDGIRCVIRGDVTSSKRVDLRNALVLGSVVAPDIYLQNCIVLGAVLAEAAPGYIHAVCSTLGLFRARRIVFEGPTTFTVAGGSTLEPPEFTDHAAKDRPLLRHAMRLLGLCRLDGAGCADWDEPVSSPKDSEAWERAPDFGARMPGITCAYWMLAACPFQPSVSIVPADFVRMRVQIDTQQEKHKVDAIRPSSSGDGEIDVRWVLQVEARAMDLTRLQQAEAQYHEVIHRIFAEEHVGDEELPLREQDAWNALSRYEQNLFGLALRSRGGRR